VKVAYRWHRRLGCVLSPLLALSACSGACLLWLQPLPTLPENPPSTQAWARALDQGLAELARRYPRAEADLVDLPRRPGDPIRVHLRLPDPAEAGWANVDAAHGSTGALQPDSRDARTRLLDLHEHLLHEGIGPWVLRAAALAALVLAAMGLRIWWRVRSLPARSPWRRWHRRVGAIVALPVLMMLATGLVLRWPELAGASLAAIAGEPATAPKLDASASPGAREAKLSEVLAAASAALPNARPMRIYAARDGVVRVRLRGDEWHPNGLDNVYLRAADASVLRIARWREQPLAMRYLDVVYPLHTGSLPGHPGTAATIAARLLWTLFALSLGWLAVSGAVQRISPPPPSRGGRR
jgi:uncharacterized iron-regulated membrane protein